MGSGQSHPSSPGIHPSSKTVRIDKSEIPEEYRNVGVSSEVVDRVLDKDSSSDSKGDGAINALKEELWEARKRNEELLAQIRRSEEDNSPLRSAGGISVDDLEERRKALNEVIERVEKQFHSYQRENACDSQEKDMMQCIMINKDQVLKCLSLLDGYQECVTNFRKQILNETVAS